MNLNLPVLSDELPHIRDFRFPPDQNHACFSKYTIFAPGIPPEQEILYLVTAEDCLPDAAFEECAFIYLSEENPNQTSPQVRCHGYYLKIALNQQTSLESFMDLLDGIFEKYNRWEQQLISASVNGASPRTLCRISYPLFQNPILVHSEEYKVLAAVDTPETPFNYTVKETGTDYMHEDAVRDLMFNPNYEKAFEEREPRLWLDVDGVTYSMYYNLHDDGGRYIGRLVVDQYRPFGHGTGTKLRFLGSFIEKSILQNSTKNWDLTKIFKQTCAKFLAGHLCDRNVLLKELATYGWGRKNRFFCILIRHSPKVSNTQTRYASLILEHYLSNCLTINYKEELLLIYNLSRNKHSRETAYEKIIYIVRENALKAGISTEFHDFFQFPDFYLQARAALETGSVIFPTQWVFRFEDVALTHLLYHGAYSLPFTTLIPGSLAALINDDKIHGTDYYHTLRSYILHDGHSQAALENLYIHRTTFTSHIKKTTKRLDIDLSSPQNRLYLKIIFRLLDTEMEKEMTVFEN